MSEDPPAIQHQKAGVTRKPYSPRRNITADMRPENALTLEVMHKRMSALQAAVAKILLLPGQVEQLVAGFARSAVARADAEAHAKLTLDGAMTSARR